MLIGMGEQTKNPVAVHSATVKHLTQHETVSVTCTCGHTSAVPVITIHTKLPAATPISLLFRYMRCRACHTRGDCRVDALAALGWGVASAS